MSLNAVARPSSAEPSSLLVLLHGLAADEYDLIGLADELDPRLYVVSYRAPHLTGYGGYSWFGIEFLADGTRRIDESEALQSREALLAELEALPKALGINPHRVILGGFSQGAMMAAGVLFAQPDLVDAAWIMSGRLIPAFDEDKTPTVRRPVLAQHGLLDEVLPVADGRELAARLGAIGHDVEFHEYPMGHQISGESLADAQAWFKRILV